MNIIFHESVSSTNDCLLELLNIDPQLPNNTVIIAKTQTAGKGRQGRSWISPPGNIYLSLYWQFTGNLDKLYGLSLVVGIAIARMLTAYGVPEIKLKWPNDIFWRQYKLGGILIETKPGKNNIINAIIGIGLNIKEVNNYQDQVTQDCIGLETILNQTIDNQALIAKLLFELNIILTKFAQHGFEAFVDEWSLWAMHTDQRLLN